MKLWRNNKIDQEWELSEEEIAKRFLASKFVYYNWPLDRNLRAFMTTPHHEGGLGSVWEDNDPAFVTVVRLVMELERTKPAPTFREFTRKELVEALSTLDDVDDDAPISIEVQAVDGSVIATDELRFNVSPNFFSDAKETYFGVRLTVRQEP